MKLRTILATLAILTLVSGVAYAAGRFTVTAREFDPAHSFLVQAEWLDGIGCPTSQDIQAFLPPDFSTTGTVTYKDLGCPTGDPSDSHNQGLLLAKTGPTNNNAAAVADIKGVKGPVTELGYDLRKPLSAVTAMGSHCGAGAPRFDVTTTTASYFIGCNSPPAVMTASSNGWIRLRWGVAGVVLGFNASTGALEPITGDVKAIQIVMDEGQDTAPDFFGLAVLDNIDVNGALVGRGANTPTRGGGDGDNGNNNDKGGND
jgi:hypothetical protein